MRYVSKLISVCLLGFVIGGCASGPAGRGLADSDSGAAVLQAGGAGRVVKSAGTAVALGDEALSRGDTDKALAFYVRALNLKPNDPQAFYKIAVVHRRKGDLARARRAFRLALACNPHYAPALEGLGLLLLSSRDFDQAHKLLTKAVKQDSGRWRAQAGLGVLADLRHAYADAEGLYLNALSSRPNDALLWNDLGYSRYLAGDWDGASKALQKALQLNPSSKVTWRNLGLLYARKKEYKKAIYAFLKVMEPASAYNNVGYIAMLDGDFPAAERALHKAIHLNPSFYVTASENLNVLMAAQDAMVLQ